jgi:hypothetical protein
MTIAIEQIYAEYPALKKFPEDVARIMYDQMHPKKTLAGIQKGDWIQDAEVLVVRVLGTSNYVGCPTCYNKAENIAEGLSFPCTHPPRCNGDQRIATRLFKWVLLGSDETTKVVLDFPPFGYKLENGEDLLCKMVQVRGRVQDPRQNKERKTGKVLSEMPVLQVKSLKILSDIRDGTPAETLIPKAAPSTMEATQPAPTKPSVATATAPAKPAPTPSAPAPTGEVTADKLNAFSLWMTFRTENGAKPVQETQVKTYVENNLHIPFAAFEPYIEKIHTDSQGEVCRLKVKVPQ